MTRAAQVGLSPVGLRHGADGLRDGRVHGVEAGLKGESGGGGGGGTVSHAHAYAHAHAHLVHAAPLVA